MNKKILFSISLMILVGLIVVVSANTNEFKIEKGWNLISLDAISGGSNLDYDLVSAMWFYDLKSKEYIQIFPENEMQELARKGIGPSEMEIAHSSIWLYSKSFQSIQRGNLRILSLEDFVLNNGFNFININSNMIGRSLNEVKGSCEIEKVYFWNSVNQKWFEFSLSELIDEGYIGLGLVIKVTSDCTLGTPTEGTNPPGLPSESDEESLRKNIEDYYYYESNLESCEFNNFAGFSSMENCQNAIRCISIELSKLINSADLSQLAEDMNGGEKAEMAVGIYLNENQDIDSVFRTKSLNCLSTYEYTAP
jgi:hypothetical protein